MKVGIICHTRHRELGFKSLVWWLSFGEYTTAIFLGRDLRYFWVLLYFPFLRTALATGSIETKKRKQPV